MDVQQANEEAGNHTISGEQARLEAALRDVESHYHSLFQAIDSGFCIVEMKFDNLDRPVDYRLVEVNPGAAVPTRPVSPTVETVGSLTSGLGTGLADLGARLVGRIGHQR